MLSTQVMTTDKKEISDYDALNNLHIDQNFIRSTKDNVAASIDNKGRPISSISGDKLHRRNPVIVRQEIQSFDDLVPETTLSDLQLSEMPGLQNTEQWKRIATRNSQTSPPLSRQYCQTTTCISESKDGYIPEILGSYRRPGRTESEQDPPPVVPSLLHTARRKILCGSSIIIIMMAITIAVVVSVILVRKPGQITTDYYVGSVLVDAPFDPQLLSLSSTLANNYQREFCSLLVTTLADAKTKYAIFYSVCYINHFRNGSIIADFILGFTRYQNVTRLNAFLTRTLVDQELFGGTILSITFNSTTVTNINVTDYETEYNDNELINLLSTEQNQNLIINNSNEQQLQITLTTTETITQSFTSNNNNNNNNNNNLTTFDKIFIK